MTPPTADPNRPPSYNFGDVRIHDLNKNGTFEPNVDKVTDDERRPLDPKVQAEKLNKILKIVEKPNWQNLSLVDTHTYHFFLHWIPKQAKAGELSWMEKNLETFRSAAKALKITVKDEWVEDQMRDARELAIPRLVDQAEKIEKQGAPLRSVEQSLNEAFALNEKLLERYRIAPTVDKERVEKILFQTYQNNFSRLGGQIQMASVKGNFEQVAELFREFNSLELKYQRRFPNQSPVRLPFTESEKIQESLEIGIPFRLAAALQLAKKGQVAEAEVIIRELKESANFANAAFSLKISIDPSKIREIQNCIVSAKTCPK